MGERSKDVVIVTQPSYMAFPYIFVCVAYILFVGYMIIAHEFWQLIWNPCVYILLAVLLVPILYYKRWKLVLSSKGILTRKLIQKHRYPYFNIEIVEEYYSFAYHSNVIYIRFRGGNYITFSKRFSNYSVAKQELIKHATIHWVERGY